MKFILASNAAEEIREAAELIQLGGVYISCSAPIETPQSKNDIKGMDVIFNKAEKICKMTSGLVFVSLAANSADEFLSAARKLLMISPNIVPALPCSVEGIKACKKMAEGDIDVCIRGAKDCAQTLSAAWAGAAFVFLEATSVCSQELSDISKMLQRHDLRCQAGVSGLKNNKEISATALTGISFGEVSIDILKNIFS